MREGHVTKERRRPGGLSDGRHAWAEASESVKSSSWTGEGRNIEATDGVAGNPGGGSAFPEQMREERRVQNLAPADYREGSELSRSIQLAVESVCKLIALRRLGRGE